MNLDLTPDELLSTTRAVRKRLDFDRPVELNVIRQCIELALQAPSGGNAQRWHWVVVTDAATRAALGEIYQRAFAVYRDSPVYAGRIGGSDPQRQDTQQRVASSADYLAANIGRAPVLVIPCMFGRVDGVSGAVSAGAWGSLLPAVWSFCLAARARGLGTSWTTLHLNYEEEAAVLLGIPFDRIAQGALIPVAYTKGTDFKPGPRTPLDPILHINKW